MFVEDRSTDALGGGSPGGTHVDIALEVEEEVAATAGAAGVPNPDELATDINREFVVALHGGVADQLQAGDDRVERKRLRTIRDDDVASFHDDVPLGCSSCCR